MHTDRIFDNTEIAFSLKSDSELERAYYLFKMISIEPLVRIGTKATNLAIKAKLPVDGLIRSTVFDHFCGGVSEEDCLPVIDKMYEKGVSSVLDYSVEGKEVENEFDAALDITLKIIDFSKSIDAMPIAVFKPTGFGRFYLYEKLGKGDAFTAAEQAEWDKVVSRFDVVCKKAKENNIAVLIDAEESWMQDAADALVTAMMKKYNTEKPVVFNTLQMYRHDRLAFLKQQHAEAKKEGYYLGYKLVRGAYMEKENERAKEKGYVSPICVSKEATDVNFNNAVKYMLDNIKEMSLFAGTHNEESSYLIMDIMQEKGLEPNDDRIWFGQLYGMSDHISFNLAEKGYNVAKYIPFGPVKDVMPYLIRRAEENTSVAGQTGRELMLLSKERKRRKKR
ncbi:proline dehydrogenase family protein [Snuella sedimenti]|uniref:Proline dehydrogenase family protein n=1 Tax=Snuella sedimenti TaxID=2798802 RepID=A0A8J7J4V9_9FLAO|nr:proline dehydrogenase family protein [Snuella sedimenti]MBJ6368654.1 proline dehydrogenase family protein [Snuella sedimenti]